MSFFSAIDGFFTFFFATFAPRPAIPKSGDPLQVYGPVDPKQVDLVALSKATDIIKLREGIKSAAYIDTEGYLTCGVGHKITSADGSWYVGKKASDATITLWFSHDITTAFNAAKAQAIQLQKYNADLIAALTAVNFQLGPNWNTKKFPNTWAALKKGNVADAITRLNSSAWKKQTPVRVADFINALKTVYA